VIRPTTGAPAPVVPLTVKTLAAASVLLLTGCGATFVDTSVTVPAVTSTTFPPIRPNTPVPELLDSIEILMLDLDHRINENEDEFETLDRINDLWRVAEVQIRRNDPTDVFNFSQAIDLARSGVERRRPADASKGYKIIKEVIDVYLTR
jgi:hypothetical protein